jgi:hypothetical protein
MRPCSALRCPLGGKGYYELEILQHDGSFPQHGFAEAAFAHVLWSWNDKCTTHKHERGEYRCDDWKDGDDIGLACDLDAMAARLGESERERESERGSLRTHFLRLTRRELLTSAMA